MRKFLLLINVPLIAENEMHPNQMTQRIHHHHRHHHHHHLIFSTLNAVNEMNGFIIVHLIIVFMLMKSL